MKYKWLNKEAKNTKVVIFFNGWGMDENVVSHLNCEDYDVLMFYDYNTLDTDFDFDMLEMYSEKNLIAWSMGVMVGNFISPLTSHFVTPYPTRGEGDELQAINLSTCVAPPTRGEGDELQAINLSTCVAPPRMSDGKTVAINGTLRPIDEKYGIHPKIYDLTIKGFNEKGRKRFISNMFEEDIEVACDRDIENQKAELIALKEICKSPPTLTLPFGEGKTLYNKILISDNDKIIPTKSQIAFWEIEPNLKGGHCPFFQFEKWSDLL